MSEILIIPAMAAILIALLLWRVPDLTLRLAGIGLIVTAPFQSILAPSASLPDAVAQASMGLLVVGIGTLVTLARDLTASASIGRVTPVSKAEPKAWTDEEIAAMSVRERHRR